MQRIEVDLQDDPDVLHLAGREFAMRGHFAAAEHLFRRAAALKPQADDWRFDLGLSILGQGRLPEGFDLYRSRRVGRPRLSWPEWAGEDVAGKSVVLFGEQGFGDQIMFARYAGALRELGADVTLLCAPALVEVVSSLGVRTLPAVGQVEFPEPDYWAMLMDVPGRLGLDLEEISGAPYLSAPAAGRGGIGVVARAKATHQNQHKSLPAAAEAELMALPGAVSLHVDDTGFTDFADTAALIAGLDVVVSVDTAVAHLAGAMGKPTHVLLPAYGADWRWFVGRSDSPWYSSMTLHRQAAPGEWGPALAAARGALGV